MPISLYKRILYVLTLAILIIPSFTSAQPVSSRSDITIRQVTTIGGSAVRLRYDPVTENLYLLENDGDVRRVDFQDNGTATLTTVYTSSDHGLTGQSILGIAFSSDGTLFLVGNETAFEDAPTGIAKIVKGIPDSLGSESRTWSVLAQTVEYNYGNVYNHKMSGITVDPGGEYIYVNSGARTDHGELRQELREVGLTSIILKLPVDSTNIILQDDREWLRSNGYLFAEGIRNDFDLEFGPNGDLFSVENSGDRDDPEEMNWLREGHHYGFPWVIGGNNTPQQYSPYDPTNDPLLNPNTWGGGNLYETFSDDPDYPARPDNIIFTSAILNMGPDADKYRDTTSGDPTDGSESGTGVTTFTAHRSPNGFVFDNDSILVEDLAGGSFVISLTTSAIAQPIGDTGEDLLHVSLTKEDDNYTAQTTRLVSNFNNPLGIAMIDNKIYVAETGLWSGNNNPRLWEITLPAEGSVSVGDDNNLLQGYELSQNYPNPFNPSTLINYRLAAITFVTLKVYDLLGSEVAELINEEKPAGIHSITFNAAGLSSGVYYYKLTAGNFSDTKKLILIK